MLFISFTKGPGGFPYVFIISKRGHHIGTNIWPLENPKGKGKLGNGKIGNKIIKVKLIFIK